MIFAKNLELVFFYIYIFQLINTMIEIRELVDAECYPLAYDFVCQVLQPACRSSQSEDLLQLPCRSFCREFWNGCGSRLPEKIKRALDCSNFPEYAGPGSCRPKPGVTNYRIFNYY